MKKLMFIIVLFMSNLFTTSFASNLSFFGNINMSMCIPFASSFGFEGEVGKGNISFNTNCDNNCYIPFFGINGGMKLGNHSMIGNMKFGIYYDCNTTNKEEVIKDYCEEIKEDVIKTSIGAKCGGGFFSPSFWMCNMMTMMHKMHKNMNQIWINVDDNRWMKFTHNFKFKFGMKKYLSIFPKASYNKYFYDLYCIDDKYKKEIGICYKDKTLFVKIYDISKYIDDGAYIGSCQSDNMPTTGDSFIKIDTSTSTINLNFAKGYKIAK